MTPQRTKRIVVAFRLAGEPGRRKLGGFLRDNAEHELDWNLRFVRIREEFSSEFVSALADRDIDGIIYSMPSAKDGAAKLSKLDIPTIALDVHDEQILHGRTTNLVYITGSADETGEDAARHFPSQGIYRSYGFVSDLQGHTWSKLRGEAFAADYGCSMGQCRETHRGRLKTETEDGR